MAESDSVTIDKVHLGFTKEQVLDDLSMASLSVKENRRKASYSGLWLGILTFWAAKKGASANELRARLRV